MTELLVFVCVVVLASLLGVLIRHLVHSSWQRGYKEGFSVGLQQRIVKVQKTTSDR
jgi:hypothetical protein